MTRIRDAIERWLDIPARWQLRIGLVALGAWLTLALLNYQLGIHMDDFWEALIARDTSWLDILIYKGIPTPLHLFIWKILVPLTDFPPTGPMRTVAAGIHVLNAVLVYAALIHLFPRRLRIALALLFFVYRGGSAALFWAPTLKDVLMTAFSLITFRCWTEGGTARKWSVVPAMLAVSCKPTAIALAPLLLLYVLWIDEGKTAVRRLTENIVPLAQVAAGIALMASIALLSPGVYGNHATGKTMPAVDSIFVYMIGQMGNYFVWSFLPISKYYAIYSAAWIVTAAAYVILTLPVLFWFFDRKIRFGIVWFLAFTLVPVYANGGSVAPHYGYSAALGILIVGGQLWILLAGRVPPAAMAIAAISWGLISLWLWPQDWHFFAANGKTGRDISLQMRWHQQEILDAGGLIAVGRILPLPPLLAPDDKVIKYLFNRDLLFRRMQECPAENEYPCITFIHDPKLTFSCWDTPPGGCSQYTPVRKPGPESFSPGP